LRTVEHTRLEFAREQPVPFVGPGSHTRAGLLVREAEPPVIGRVADE